MELTYSQARVNHLVNNTILLCSSNYVAKYLVSDC